MNENPQKERDLWSIVEDLATLQQSLHFEHSLILDKKPDLEACLRRVLRPHDEAGFESPKDRWMVDLRQDLDAALEELTFREIRNQLGLANEQLPRDTGKNLRILFRSEAFLRYLNAYLYFAIRFLANRKAFRPDPRDNERPACPDANVLRLPLCIPPTLAGYPGAQIYFELFRKQRREESSPIKLALSFLDDFHPQRKQPVQYELREPSEYELWLRGLRPETGEQQRLRFETISTGLTDWVILRSEFYLSLSPHETAGTGSNEAEVNEIKSQDARPLEGWLVTHPIAARLALADVYWIARLLRADVSDDGAVTYQKPSWLHLLRFRAILAGDLELTHMLEKAEEGIRSVFGYVCDLIQNSVELTQEDDRRKAEAAKT